MLSFRAYLLLVAFLAGILKTSITSARLRWEKGGERYKGKEIGRWWCCVYKPLYRGRRGFQAYFVNVVLLRVIKMIQRALLVLLLLASARRRPFANSAKVKCKTCKDFVDSFNKVRPWSNIK